MKLAALLQRIKFDCTILDKKNDDIYNWYGNKVEQNGFTEEFGSREVEDILSEKDGSIVIVVGE